LSFCVRPIKSRTSWAPCWRIPPPVSIVLVFGHVFIFASTRRTEISLRAIILRFCGLACPKCAVKSCITLIVVHRGISCLRRTVVSLRTRNCVFGPGTRKAYIPVCTRSCSCYILNTFDFANAARWTFLTFQKVFSASFIGKWSLWTLAANVWFYDRTVVPDWTNRWFDCASLLTLVSTRTTHAWRRLILQLEGSRRALWRLHWTKISSKCTFLSGQRYFGPFWTVKASWTQPRANNCLTPSLAVRSRWTIKWRANQVAIYFECVHSFNAKHSTFAKLLQVLSVHLL